MKKYSLKIGVNEVGKVDLVTRCIEGGVVQLDGIPLEMLDHFLDTPETQMLNLTARLCHLHPQVLWELGD